MSKFIKNVKEILKAEKFVLLFMVFISATLIYLLVKSPSIKTTTEIQLDGAGDSTTIQVDTITTDTLQVDTIQ